MIIIYLYKDLLSHSIADRDAIFYTLLPEAACILFLFYVDKIYTHLIRINVKNTTG